MTSNIDEWDNTVKGESGITNAQQSAVWAGERLNAMPVEIENDAFLIGAYVHGLERAIATAQKDIKDSISDYKDGELSQYFAITGEVLTADELESLKTETGNRVALGETLIDSANKVKNDLNSNGNKLNAFMSSEGYRNAVPVTESKHAQRNTSEPKL